MPAHRHLAKELAAFAQQSISPAQRTQEGQNTESM
jgi:hypothetical protein